MKDQLSSAKIDPATGRPLPAGVEYRGKGQYRARKRITGSERIHQTFSTAKLARRWLDTTSAKLELGQFEDTRPLERQTVHELVDRYVREVMQTRDNDRKGHIPSILQHEIAQLPLVDLTSTAVRGFRDRLAEKYSAATVVKRLNLLAAICQHAVAEWDLPFSKNPAAATAVKRPAGADKKRNRRLIGDEYDRLLEAMALSSWPDDAIFVQFAIEQGTRREEALTLRWRDIDFDRHALSLGKTKTINGLYKAEVIHHLGPWKSMAQLEWETLRWVDWYNNRRLLAPIGYRPPAEAERAFYEDQSGLDIAA